MHDYLNQFPIPAAQLPARLRGLLQAVPNDPQIRVEVATSYDFDHYGPNREYVHMIMALTPEPKPSFPRVPHEAGDGVVSFSTPVVETQGELAVVNPSVSGLDYVVASWGNGSFYSYNLSEKIWMTLGLSPRCLGGNIQKVIYDDLSLPEFGVAEGEISTEYYFSPRRDIHWVISNEYLRRYLWMRGAYGMRVFFYEALLPDSCTLRALMGSEAHVQLAENAGWYTLDIREHQAKLLIQVWAAVVAIPPERCPEQSADGLMWPGTAKPMNRNRANALTEIMPVYLDDQFLEKYEQNSLFDTVPVNVDGRWLCSPSYLGQWSFTDCCRIGRNIIRVPMRELYKPKPDREILHAHAHVLDPAKVVEFAQDEEHIASKTHRFVEQLLDLGAQLEALGAAIGKPKCSKEIVGFSRAELSANGWLNYPDLCHLARVAPLAMTEQAFLSRCKDICELWQRIPSGFLRTLIARAGHTGSGIKELGSIKLLQVLSNVVERLNAHGECLDSYGTGGAPDDLTTQNSAFVALFVNYDLRIAHAHNTGDVPRSLEKIGFDVAVLNQGYGRALDHLFDSVIKVFSHLNTELGKLLRR
jgi:hypothetical protein